VCPKKVGSLALATLLLSLFPWGWVGEGAQSQAPSQVHLSWSENDVYHTMTAMWHTKARAESKVRYDLHPHNSWEDYDEKALGKAHEVRPAYDRHGKKIKTKFSGFYHEVELSGLKPGTTYYFRVGSPDSFSQEWCFKTIGTHENVKFVVGGDSRRMYEGERRHPLSVSNWPENRNKITGAAASEDPDFIVFIGDMVLEGANQEHWNNWFGMMQELLVKDGRMIPIVAVIGNHEMGKHPDTESTYDWFTGLFANPGNELWYSLDFPNLHLTILSATGGCIGTWWEGAEEEAPKQASWLEADLAGSRARWKLVAFHVPYYNCRSAGTGYASEVYLRDWAEVIEDPQYEVDLVACGHVHNYMRSFPLRTEIEEVAVEKRWTNVGYRAIPEISPSSEEGVSYIVQGGWGAPTDPYLEWGRCKVRDFMAAYTSVHSYTLIELEHGKLYLSTRDFNGKVYDEQVFPYYVEEEEPEVSEEEVVSEEGEKEALLATKIKEEGRGALAAKDDGGVFSTCTRFLQNVSESTGDMATEVFKLCSCSPCIRAAYDMVGLVAG